MPLYHKYPAKLKIAQVVPVHKKNSTLCNYRPVSVLPAVSKIFERAVYIQIVDFFITILIFFYQLSEIIIAAKIH